MNSNTISNVKSTVEDMLTSIQDFKSNTLTDKVWQGDASDNLKNEINEKLEKKISIVNDRLSALQRALELNVELDRYLSEKKSLIYKRNLLNPKVENYHSVYNHYTNEIRIKDNAIIRCETDIRKICGGI